MHQLGGLRLHQAVERDAGGLGDDLGDVLGVDLLLEHRSGLLDRRQVSGGFLDAAFEFGDAAVADLGGGGEVGLTFDLRAQPFELLLERADGVDRLLLLLPALLHLGDLHVERGELVVQSLEAFLRGLVGLLVQGDLLDLELEDASLDDVDLGRQ